jgi:hypothetical protein
MNDIFPLASILYQTECLAADLVFRFAKRSSFQAPLGSCATYHCVICTSELLCQPHQQNIRPVLNPVIVKLLFRLGSDGVVGCAQGAEQLRKRGVDFGR